MHCNALYVCKLSSSQDLGLVGFGPSRFELRQFSFVPKNINLPHFFSLLGKILVMRVLPAYRNKFDRLLFKPPALLVYNWWWYDWKTHNFILRVVFFLCFTHSLKQLKHHVIFLLYLKLLFPILSCFSLFISHQSGLVYILSP